MYVNKLYKIYIRVHLQIPNFRNVPYQIDLRITLINTDKTFLLRNHNIE